MVLGALHASVRHCEPTGPREARPEDRLREAIQTTFWSVASKAEFVQFLEELRADLKQHPDEWESPTLDRYLEAMAAWVNDSDGYYRNIGQPVPENVSWRFFAQVLTAARSYE